MSTSTAEPGSVAATTTGRLARLRTAPIWSAAAIRDFRLLWASEGVSILGDQFHAVAMSWLIITLTGSGVAVATVLIAVSVPRALLLAPMGVMADRRSQRSLMLFAHLARAAIVAAIALLVASGNASIPSLAALGFLFGAADAVYMPSQQAFVPRAVGSERLPSANALMQGTLQLISIVGPPLAGLVVAAAGTAIAFGVDAASFVLAAGLIALITTTRGRPASAASPSMPTGGAAPESFLSSLRAGLRYALDDRGIAAMLAVSLVINFALNGPAAVGMAWLAELRYHAGATGLGLMAAGFSVGGLAGAVIAGNARLERRGRLLLGALAVAGCATAGVGLAGSLWPAVVLFGVAGLMIGFVNVVAISWLQARVETAMLGRVMSLAMLVGFGVSPLSMAVAGGLIDLNATGLFVGAGALVVVTAVAALALGTAELFDTAKPAADGSMPSA